MRRWVGLCALVIGAMRLSPSALAQAAAPEQGPFRDVPLQHWAYDAVNELAALGIIIGYPDGTFRGGSAMTRYELATFFHCVTIANPGLGAEPPPNVPDAPSHGSRPHLPAGWNVAAGHWALNAVAALADRHVLSGYPDGRFDVGRPVTRYEAVLALHRILKRTVSSSYCTGERSLDPRSPEWRRHIGPRNR